MPNATIVVENMVFDLPERPFPADFIFNYLNLRRAQRLRARMAAWVEKQSDPPTQAEFQSELDRQCAAFIFTDEEREDSVEAEAIALAEDVIRRKLAESDFPVPRNLRDHALQLIMTDGSYRIRARERIEAKALAANEMAAGLIGSPVSVGDL